VSDYRILSDKLIERVSKLSAGKLRTEGRKGCSRCRSRFVSLADAVLAARPRLGTRRHDEIFIGRQSVIRSATVKDCESGKLRLPKYCETCLTGLTGYVNVPGSPRTPNLFHSPPSPLVGSSPPPPPPALPRRHKTSGHLNTKS
jgi:hypothetical protein